jgi:hypothetical protein
MNVLKRFGWATYPAVWLGVLLLGIWLGEWCGLQSSRPLSIPLRFEEVHAEQRPWLLDEAAPPAAQPAAFAAVYGPNYVRQDFRCPADNLKRVAVWMAGPVGEVVALGLHSQESDVHYRAQIEIDRASGGYYSLVFPSVPASKGRVFSLVVAAPDASFERAISLRIAPRDRLGGFAYLNLYPVTGNVDLATYHSGPPGRWWLDVLYEQFVPTAFRTRMQQYKPQWAKGVTFSLLVVTGFGLSFLVLLVEVRHRSLASATLLALVLLTGCLSPSISQMFVRRGQRAAMSPVLGDPAFSGCCPEEARLASSPHSTYDLLMNLDKASRDLTRERDRDYARPEIVARSLGSRPGLALAGGHSMAWNVQVQPGTSFRSALASLDECSWFELWVRADDTHVQVFRQLVPPGGGDWEPMDVDLGDYAGQSIKLELACPEEDCLWGAPHLLTDGSWLQPYSFPVSIQEQANFGGEIQLLGYTLEPSSARPGETIYIDLYWHALQDIETDYTVFVHLLDDAGTYVVGQDSWPVLDTFPTTLWTPDHVVLDSHAFPLPPGLLPGRYTLQIGLYELETMTRLAAYDTDDNRLANDVVWLEGSVSVEDQP